MKYKLTPFALLFFSITFFLSCGRNINSCSSYYRLQISLKENIGIKNEEVEAVFFRLIKQNPESRCLAQIIIYSYSTSKDRFFYSENDINNVRVDSQKGNIEALLKINNESGIKKNTNDAGIINKQTYFIDLFI